MSINISYEPIRAIADLATQAGQNEANQQMQAEHDRLLQMKQQHDTAMQEQEFHAQTQADAQFREQHFQKALRGEQFQNHQLTLEEQYGWNLKLDRAKADIALQAKITEHAQKVQEWEAQKKQIQDYKYITPQQKEELIAAGELKLNSGASLPQSMTKEPTYPTQLTQIYNPETGKNEMVMVDKAAGQQIRTVGQAKTSSMTPSQKSSEEDRLSMNLERQGKALQEAMAMPVSSKATPAAKQTNQKVIDRLQANYDATQKKLNEIRGDKEVKTLDKVTAASLLQESGWDKAKARQLAIDRGYTL
jgi:hypothetical protein